MSNIRGDKNCMCPFHSQGIEMTFILVCSCDDDIVKCEF